MTTETEVSGLLELADRCEAAAGPDRELDAVIWLACVPGTARKETRYLHKATGSERIIDETRENHRLVIVPAYTASIDAALTLVPKGWSSFKLDCNAPGTWWTAISYPVGDSWDVFVGQHSERPLSICAAALRARATKESASE